MWEVEGMFVWVRSRARALVLLFPPIRRLYGHMRHLASVVSALNAEVDEARRKLGEVRDEAESIRRNAAEAERKFQEIEIAHYVLRSDYNRLVNRLDALLQKRRP